MENYNPFSLSGKTIFVTGASSGIGRAIAVECSRMGATVILTARNAERLEKTLSMLEGTGHAVVAADLTEENDRKHLIESLPVLDGVVQNAGVFNTVLTKNIQQKDLDYVLPPNLYAPILLQKELVKHKLLAKGSSVVFMSSIASLRPFIGNAVYTISKAGITGYAKVLALELAPKSIRVNCICPGIVRTDLTENSVFSTEEYKAEEMKYPLKRYGKPEEIAYMAVYLLSDASAWVTGTTMEISGGINLI